jgi:TonB family protein
MSVIGGAAAGDAPAYLGTGDRDLSFGMKVSLLLHVALLAAVILKSLVFPGEPEVWTPALRVDIVGLPEVLKQDLAQLPPLPPAAQETPPPTETAEPPPKAEAKPMAPPEDIAKPDEMVLDAKRVAEKKREEARSERERRNKMLNALARIRALNKIQGEETAEAGPLIKGNQISRGASLSGQARESAAADYRDALLARIQRNWALPTWLARQKFAARVVITVDAAGRILNYRFLSTSGNAQFDDAVKAALARSQPFAPPPAELRDQLASRGVVLGFPL